MRAGEILMAETLDGFRARYLGEGVAVQTTASDPLDFTVTHPILQPGRAVLVLGYAVMGGGSGTISSATRAQSSVSVLGSPTSGRTIRGGYVGDNTNGLGWDLHRVFETPPTANGSITVRFSYSGDGMNRGLNTVTWSPNASFVQVIDLGPIA